MTAEHAVPRLRASVIVTSLRRELIQGHRHWEEVHGRYSAGNGAPATAPGTAQNDADAASLMAASYSYALAALLRVAEAEFGTDAAQVLAAEVRTILEDGDEDDLNADVILAAGAVPG